VFDFRQFNPQTGEDSFVSSNSIRGKTLWQMLSEKGKKVIVLNLPLTYPPYPINGIMVAGFDSPSKESIFTYPKNLQKEIISLIPDYDFILSVDNDYRFESSFNNFLENILKAFNQRYRLSKYLLEQYPDWDVFMVQFQNIDHLQHRLWNYLRKFSCDTNKRVSSVIKCYEHLDKLIKTLFAYVENKDEETYKIILSDHGFGYAAFDMFPNNLLKDWGILVLDERKKRKSDDTSQSLTNKICKKIKSFIGPHIKLRYLDILRNTSFERELPIDWSKTKAYIALAEIYAFGFINKIGREPHGIVKEKEIGPLLNQICLNFLNIKDDFSGKRLFSEVLLRKDFFENPQNPLLPDFILIPEEGICLKRGLLNNGYIRHAGIQGTHRENGILIVNHNENVIKNCTDFQAKIIDMAPTILNIMDIPIPNDIDGKVLVEIFKKLPNEVKYTESSGSESSNHQKKNILSGEEELIEKRLKGLGYL